MNDTTNPNRSCQGGNVSDRTLSENDDQQMALQIRMSRIRHKILVLSGKGGVGKSTVAVNLAASLAMAGRRVGLLDVDIHGPSVPRLLNIHNNKPQSGADGMLPVACRLDDQVIQVMSIGFLLSEKNAAVIWRGPRKYGLIRQFLSDIVWGDLDYLIVDAPPGTGDEPLAVAELIDDADGAVIVTTPQEIAVQDVRRCIVFCQQMELPVLGVVENMSGFTCPDCGRNIRIFGADGGRLMAQEMSVPFLGEIPIEPAVVTAGDSGIPTVKAHPDSATAKAFAQIVQILTDPASRAGTDASGLQQTSKG